MLCGNVLRKADVFRPRMELRNQVACGLAPKCSRNEGLALEFRLYLAGSICPISERACLGRPERDRIRNSRRQLAGQVTFHRKLPEWVRQPWN